MRRISTFGAAILVFLIVGGPAEGDLTDGLLAHWSLDQGTTVDDSGNGFHGQVIGTLTPTAGMCGEALDFPGTSSYFEVFGDELGMEPGLERTFSLWVYSRDPLHGGGTGSGGPIYTHALITKYKFPRVWESDFYSAIWTVGGTPLLGSWGMGTDKLFTETFEIDRWHHVAFVFKDGPGASRIYVDGTLATEDTLRFAPGISAQPFRVGNVAGAGDLSFNGVLDEIRVYDRVLSDQEIEDLRQLCLCSLGPPEPFVAVRERGKPVWEEFSWESCGGEGILRIQNEGTSSAIVYLNGDLVADPSDFHPKIPLLEIPVTLQEGENLLTVQLRSAPGSSLTFDVVEAPSSRPKVKSGR